MQAGEESEYQAYGDQLSQSSLWQNSSPQMLSGGQKRKVTSLLPPKKPSQCSTFELFTCMLQRKNRLPVWKRVKSPNSLKEVRDAWNFKFVCFYFPNVEKNYFEAFCSYYG